MNKFLPSDAFIIGASVHILDIISKIKIPLHDALV